MFLIQTFECRPNLPQFAVLRNLFGIFGHEQTAGVGTTPQLGDKVLNIEPVQHNHEDLSETNLKNDKNIVTLIDMFAPGNHISNYRIKTSPKHFNMFLT